ncbi:MAG: type I methionyl aminopeptidase [Phycisphaerales bacterium]|nr:type I methionyl aminopeptidase [Phycisphaerales bacterium]
MKSLVKKPADVQGARDAASRVCAVHDALVGFLRPGVTLAEVDNFVATTLHQLDSRSAFLRYRASGYPPFPSHSCLSPNDVVVHGTHLISDDPLVEGDILSVDIGVLHKGWIGDAAWTYALGGISDEDQRLLHVGRQSLIDGLAAIAPGKPLIDWARAVQNCVERDEGMSLVRGLGGHGYGRQLHGPPFVSNVVPTMPGEWPDAFRTWTPGMLVAVEPMLNLGSADVEGEAGGWPIRTSDGRRSAHYEADVLITEDGVDVLTAPMLELPDVVGA